MNETSWETIDLVDCEYDELIVFDGKVYADAFIESAEELEEYTVLTPNEVLEVAVEGLLFTEQDSIENILSNYKNELDLLGIQTEWFKANGKDVEFAKLSIPGKANYWIENVVCAEYDPWDDDYPCGYHYKFEKIEESTYDRACQAEVDKLAQSAAKFGYQLIPA